MSPCTSSTLVSRLIGGTIAVCLTAVCSSSFASETGCSNSLESGASPSHQANQVVSINPETGALLKADIPESIKPAQRDTSQVEIRELPDGTVVADVGDRFRSHLIAEVVDGKLVTCHRTGNDHLDPVEIKEEQDE